VASGVRARRLAGCHRARIHGRAELTHDRTRGLSPADHGRSSRRHHGLDARLAMPPSAVATPGLVVASQILIVDNAILTTLAGLLQPSTRTLSTVRVEGNPALTDLGDLPIERISGRFYVDDNDALTALTGFPSSLVEVGELFIFNNDNLTALTPHTPTINDSLSVYNNPLLPTCLINTYRMDTGYPDLQQSDNDDDAICP